MKNLLNKLDKRWIVVYSFMIGFAFQALLMGIFITPILVVIGVSIAIYADLRKLK